MQPLNLPTNNSEVIAPNGAFSISWYRFFTGLLGRLGGNPGLIPLAQFPVTSLPSPAQFSGTLIIVTGSVTGKTLATSNGTHWLWADGSIVS